MKAHLIVLIIVLATTLTELCGQVQVEVSKTEFKEGKEGFRDAWKSIREGDKLYRAGVGMYPEAVLCYLLANDYNSENAELNYKIGVTYLGGSEPAKSLEYFLKAYDLKPGITEDILLLTGKAYHLRGDYGKAIDYYNMYSDRFHGSDTFNPVVNNYINQCNRAIEMSESGGDYELLNAGENINSEYDDYSPVPSAGDRLLYFTSRRPVDAKRARQNIDMKWDENIFVATRGADDWDPAGPAGDNLSTELNEGILFIGDGGSNMYIYAGYQGNGDILTAGYENGEWSIPHKPPVNINSIYREASISVTADENEIFFTSDMKKGLGRGDIYYIKRVRRNKWTRPFNLGDPVNSERNEVSVFVSPGGDTIWFSSDRFGGMGGYDIYMSVKDDIGLWSDPVNVGPPVNSQSNDIFYRRSAIDTDQSWLASDRPGGYGDYDIYMLVKKNALARDSVVVDTSAIIDNRSELLPDSLRIKKE
jgi:tetratricopeptide (TPR) repeat protein